MITSQGKVWEYTSHRAYVVVNCSQVNINFPMEWICLGLFDGYFKQMWIVSVVKRHIIEG